MSDQTVGAIGGSVKAFTCKGSIFEHEFYVGKVCGITLHNVASQVSKVKQRYSRLRRSKTRARILMHTKCVPPTLGYLTLEYTYDEVYILKVT